MEASNERLQATRDTPALSGDLPGNAPGATGAPSAAVDALLRAISESIQEFEYVPPRVGRAYNALLAIWPRGGA